MAVVRVLTLPGRSLHFHLHDLPALGIEDMDAARHARIVGVNRAQYLEWPLGIHERVIVLE